MNTKSKIHLVSALTAVLLAVLYWSEQTTFSRQYGMLSKAFAPIALVVIVAYVTPVVLVWRQIRDDQRRFGSVRFSKWKSGVQSWSVAIYFLPLLYQYRTESHGIESDGATSVTVFSYGFEYSALVFVGVVFSALMWQVRMHRVREVQFTIVNLLVPN